MKIAFVSDRVYPYYIGGYELLIYNLAANLSRSHSVTIFTSMDEPYKVIGGIQYKKISEKLGYVDSKGIHNVRDSLTFGIRALRNVEKLNSYDLVVLNTIPYVFLGYMLSKVRTKKISIFYEAWYDYLHERNFVSRNAIYHSIRSIVESSDAIVAVSSSTERSLIRNYNAKNVYRIPVGINMNDAPTLNNRNFDLIYLGRLAQIKHVDSLIIASQRIRKYFPDLRVAIAGAGVDEQRLIQLARKLDLDGTVNFLGSFSEEQKYPLLSSSRIFVLPSEREGFSISALEAMYCGSVPVIARPKYDEVFGTSDFVIDNHTGLYFQLGSIDDMVKKITKLLTDDGIYANLKKNGVDLAKKYDWRKIAGMYDDIFSAV